MARVEGGIQAREEQKRRRKVKVESKVQSGTKFSEKLNDRESEEFKNLAEKVISMTKPALDETAKKNNAKVSVRVLSFFAEKVSQ